MRIRNRNKVTMKDIAEEAGVTLSTVSRVLSQKPGYAEETREKIFGVANRLKYRPNALIRGMQTGHTGMAGVMVPASGFYSGIVDGMHQVFVNNNTIMLLSWNIRIESNREDTLERQIIHQMVDLRADGIILRPGSEEFERPYFEEIWERDIPLILVDRHLTKISTHFVGTDDQAGGRAAAEHLIALGHRSMLFVGAHQSVSTSRGREEGFRRVMSQSPNAYCRSLVYQAETIRDDLAALLGGENAPTAIFCYNDETARKIESVLRAAGISIPKDVSLIGFGNMPVYDEQLPLTTFDQHQSEIGKTAAELYLECTSAETRSSPQIRMIKPDLIIRSSTAPLG